MFQQRALAERSALGVSGLPLIVIDHPLGGERPESVSRRAAQAMEQLAGLLSGPR